MVPASSIRLQEGRLLTSRKVTGGTGSFLPGEIWNIEFVLGTENFKLVFLSSRKHATVVRRYSVAARCWIRPNYGAGEPYLAGKQKNVGIKRIKLNLCTHRERPRGHGHTSNEEAAARDTPGFQRQALAAGSVGLLGFAAVRFGSQTRRFTHTNSLSAALSYGPAFQAWLGRDGLSAPRVPAGKSEAPPLRAAFTGPTSKKQTRILKSCRFTFEN